MYGGIWETRNTHLQHEHVVSARQTSNLFIQASAVFGVEEHNPLFIAGCADNTVP